MSLLLLQTSLCFYANAECICNSSTCLLHTRKTLPYWPNISDAWIHVLTALKRAICFIDTRHGVHLASRSFEFYEIWGEHLNTHRQFSFRQSLPTNKQIIVFFSWSCTLMAAGIIYLRKVIDGASTSHAQWTKCYFRTQVRRVKMHSTGHWTQFLFPKLIAAASVRGRQMHSLANSHAVFSVWVVVA